MYRYELHCHENIVSRCGVWSPEELVKHYAERGYTGIVVSDHFFNGSCAVERTLPWKEKVELFCSGYERAKIAGDRCGLDVFFAFEYSVNTFYGEDLRPLGDSAGRIERKNTMAGCDFLIYGLGKEWLLSKDENILSLPVNEFLKMVKAEGGTVIQAHPFRLAQDYMDHISLFPTYTDGVEIYNGNPNTVGAPNRLAKAYAKEFGFFCAAGSDSHRESAYYAVTKLEKRVSSVAELIDELKAGRAKLSLLKNRKK